MPSIAYRRLPESLTAPLATPLPPPLLCELDGVPAVCVLDALAREPAWDAFAALCNADRRRAALLGATDGEE